MFRVFVVLVLQLLDQVILSHCHLWVLKPVNCRPVEDIAGQNTLETTRGLECVVAAHPKNHTPAGLLALSVKASAEEAEPWQQKQAPMTLMTV